MTESGASPQSETGRVASCPHTSWGRVGDGPFVCRDCQQEIPNPVNAGRVATPLEVLTEALLTSRTVMMEDGYPSIVQRSREEAAQVALDALAEAGYEVVRRG